MFLPGMDFEPPRSGTTAAMLGLPSGALMESKPVDRSKTGEFYGP
jgi:hypothetical protein